MNLIDKLSKVHSVFIDTAPIIYFVEGHPQYGQLCQLPIHSRNGTLYLTAIHFQRGNHHVQNPDL